MALELPVKLIIEGFPIAADQLDSLNKRVAGLQKTTVDGAAAGAVAHEKESAALTKLAHGFDMSRVAAEQLVMALGPLAVLTAVVGFLKNANDANQKVNTSTTLLTLQLGHFSEALLDQADALSKSLYVNKEDILAADQRMLVYTREESSIKKLIPGIIDLAKLKGIDLVAATNAVGVSLKKADEVGAGHIGTIRGMGITYKTMATEAENVAEIEKKLKESVGGAAQAVADSLGGWAKFGFWVSKITEETGKGIFGASKVEKEANDYARNVAMIKSDTEELQKVQNTKADAFKMVSKEDTIDVINKEIASFKLLTKAYEDKQDKLQKQADAAAAGAKAEIALEENDKLNKEIAQTTLEGQRQLAKDEAKAELAAGADKILVAKALAIKLAKINAKPEKAPKEDKEAAERAKTIADAAKEAAQVGMTENQKEIDDLTRTLHEKQALIGANLYAQADLITAYNAKVKAITDKDDKDAEKKQKERENALQKQTEDHDKLELTKEDKKYKTKMQKLTAFFAKRLKDEKAAGVDTVDTWNEYEKESSDVTKEENDAKTKYQEEYATHTLSQAATLINGLKGAAGAKKAIAMAEAGVDAGKGVMGVVTNSDEYIANFGPVAGPVAMGVEIALIAGIFAEQLAKISAQKMAAGGVVQGGVSGRDSVPALLMPGEIVYNPARPDPNLASMITGGSSSSITHINTGDIHIHGNASHQTVQAVQRATERGVMSALKRMQQSGKVTATGLKIRG